MKSAVILLIAVFLVAVAAPPQTNPDERIVRPSPSRSNQRQKPDVAQAPPAPAVDQQEIEAMRADLARMRALLNQMRTNLAFVQTSDTPLKHQFDLNNEMWQMLVSDLDRRVQKLEQHKP